MTRQDFIVNNLKDLSSKYAVFLSRNEIFELSDKTFKVSGFSGYNKDEVFKILKNNEVIFGLLTGFIFTDKEFYFFRQSFKSYERVRRFSFDDFLTIEAKHRTFLNKGELSINQNLIEYENLHSFQIEAYEMIKKSIEDAHLEYENYLENLKMEAALIEKNRVLKLKREQEDTLVLLDKDNDGDVDLIDVDFNKILSKNQKKIIEADKKYIHQFVKVSNYIKTKKVNTQKIFESIKDTANQEELQKMSSLLKNQIHSYELIVFHSVNMIGALVTEDLITFYEIYESFDKIGMFNSNWENEVSEKLTNIGNKLDDLMHLIYNMEQNIIAELDNLSYITQESFKELNISVTNQLKEVESSINFNNLLTGIQTYQMYKLNKNLNE